MTKLIFTMLLGLATAAFTRQALAQGGTWKTEASMSTARIILAGAQVNGIVYAIGGYNESGGFNPLATVEAYDPVTDTWSSKAAMPIALYGLAAAAVNGIVYTVGGNASGYVWSSVEAYDPVTNTWTTKAAMPTPRWLLAAAEVNGIVYAIGGDNYGNFNTVEAYDPVANTWSTKAAMPTARNTLAAVEVNGIVYAIGGYSNSLGSPLNTMEAYDPVTDTWSSKAAMPTARYLLTAAAVNGIVYAIGGYNGSTFLNTVEAYDPVTNTWTTDAAMPTARLGLAAAAVDGIVYAIGGQNDGGSLATNEAFTPPRCPHPQGYWKSNPTLWPASSLPMTLGNQTYSKTELLTILKTSVGTGTKADASLILADQLIAAKLNIANGSDPSPVSSTITHADSLLFPFSGKLPYKVKTSSAIGQMMVNDGTTLGNYNNGLLTLVCTP
jgi:N-acetylneuraminic acid mutarotase